MGAKVFIGHGRSTEWLKLKDFIQNKLKIECLEFNTHSSAGLTTTERLDAMLDEACFAFLVMTAEDKHGDGKFHARENVIHEAGLFQGRLGRKKAIVLLEEGCEEFSNIHGLVQIRFPGGDIQAKSESIRDVLQREGVLDNAGLSRLVPAKEAEGTNKSDLTPLIIFRRGFYWRQAGENLIDGPYCPQCYSKDAFLAGMHPSGNILFPNRVCLRCSLKIDAFGMIVS